MGVPLAEIMARLPEDERQEVEARAAELIAQEMTLRELRKAMGKTQVSLARTLKIKQENVSRLEQRTDMLLSTLGSFVKAMGGELDITARFKGRPPVRLTGFSELAPAKPAAKRAPARPRRSRKTDAAA